MSHGHGGGCSHGHSHEDDITDPARGNQFSLYLKIDTEKVVCLNETDEGSGKTVFKPWDKRLDREKFVESDCDEELLFNIPFTGQVKLKGIIVVGGEDDMHPSEMKLYKNRPNMTFDDAGAEPEQTFEMHPDPNGVMEYATKIAKFNSVEHLSLYFPKNFGNDVTKVYYIGLRGDFTEAHRHGVTIVTYEARANPADHKTSNADQVNH